uniref:Uncharacterized protein n=1 Tax=Ditylenchus dipsaci TaxID=166011 RepID=A0A915EGW4_9BILA
MDHASYEEINAFGESSDDDRLVPNEPQQVFMKTLPFQLFQVDEQKAVDELDFNQVLSRRNRLSPSMCTESTKFVQIVKEMPYFKLPTMLLCLKNLVVHYQ